jgi:hypothetical protein
MKITSMECEGDFCCDFLLLIDVKEWIGNECSWCMSLHLNICDWFTHSHPSKGENSLYSPFSGGRGLRQLILARQKKALSAIHLVITYSKSAASESTT